MPQKLVRKTPAFVKVDIAYAVFKEGKYFVVYCPALELSSYGKTEKDAKAAFLENLKIFLNETYKKGTLEKCLLQLGWQLQQKPKPVYTPPTISLADSAKILEKNPKVYNQNLTVPV